MVSFLTGEETERKQKTDVTNVYNCLSRRYRKMEPSGVPEHFPEVPGNKMRGRGYKLEYGKFSLQAVMG